MKILHITPEAPSTMSGGGIGVRQTLLSLTENHYEVDYVGPDIPDQELKNRYHRTYILEPGRNILLRIYDTLFMNTNRRYRSWLKLKLDFHSYDIIVMEFTKLHYVSKRIGNTPFVVRVHNVEYDYSQNNARHHRTLVNWMDARFAGPRERLIIKQADGLITLTQKDKERLCQLYSSLPEKITVVPICVMEHSGLSAFSLKKTDSNDAPLRMLITGSLWYGSNYEGIGWFIEHVYSQLTLPKVLCIAGARPNPDLQLLAAADPSITLIDTPPDMSPYFLNADLFIAPIFDGAGMKVKVAEALSYALPVVGTHHAFEGYSISSGVNSFLADTAKEFQEKINQYYNSAAAKQEHISKAAYQLFQAYYSIEKSSFAFKEFINKYTESKESLTAPERSKREDETYG